MIWNNHIYPNHPSIYRIQQKLNMIPKKRNFSQISRGDLFYIFLFLMIKTNIKIWCFDMNDVNGSVIVSIHFVFLMNYIQVKIYQDSSDICNLIFQVVKQSIFFFLGQPKTYSCCYHGNLSGRRLRGKSTMDWSLTSFTSKNGCGEKHNILYFIKCAVMFLD